MGWDDTDFNSSDYNENYQYTPEDMDTSQQFTPNQGVDSFLGQQGNYQIDGNYFGQNQDWGNQNWGMENQQTSFGGMPAMQQQGQQALPQAPQTGTQDFLSRLFSNPGVLAKGIGALFEGSQNKKMGRSMNQIAQNPALDPFGSQRPFYQQQLQQSVTNPYDSPMVKAQVDNIQRMQDIKDAAAGRRSNSLSSAPGVLAAQAGVAQKYMDSLQRPAGAFNGPSGDTIAKLLQGGAKYNSDGYTSPIFNAIGNTLRNQQFDDSRQQELEQLARLFSRG